MSEVETARSSFGIHDDGPRRDLSRSFECAVQGVEQEMLAQSRSLQGLSDGHPPKKRNRKWKARQSFCHVWREIRARDRMRRKTVKAGDRFTIRCENENSSEFAFKVLAGLLLQIDIELGHTATEARPIVMRFERFDSVIGGQSLTRHYSPCASNSAGLLPSCANWASEG